MSDLNIRVEGADAFFSRLGKHAKKFDETGLLPAEDSISFATLDLFLKVMTPKRWLLVKRLRRLGPTSIRALAMALKREYKAVHTDVIALINAGLIERDDQQLISVPWTRVVTETNLEAA